MQTLTEMMRKMNPNQSLTSQRFESFDHGFASSYDQRNTRNKKPKVRKVTFGQSEVGSVSARSKLAANEKSLEVLDKLSSKHAALDESRGLQPQAFKKVVKTVNKMSKQLLNDMGAPNLIQKDPYGNFINAVVAVEEPAITNNLDGQAFEYEESLGYDSQQIQDQKRMKRHLNTKRNLQSKRLMIVPEGQLEEQPGASRHPHVNFDIFALPINHKPCMKKRIAESLKRRAPISNIVEKDPDL